MLAWHSPGCLSGAVLSGTVLEARTGRPLARTSVQLESLRGGSGQSGYTDANGRFTFSSLAAGAYIVSASKKGYAGAKYGQRQANAPGSPVVLEDASTFYAELRLRKLGVLTGEVVDENQVGIPNFLVYAYRTGPRLKLAATAETDDRGTYRLAGLEPGRYLVMTAARELEDRRGLLPTYFGRTARSAEARPVAIRLDEEVNGLVIEPLPGRLSSLQGTLSATVPASVTLWTDTGKREVSLEAGGPFSFDQLAPGTYELIAESGGARPLTDYRRVVVSKEVETAGLTLGTPPSLRVACEEERGRPVDALSISIFVRRIATTAEAPQQMKCGEEAALSPGDWEIAAVGPGNWYLSSWSGVQHQGGAYVVNLPSRGARQLTVRFSAEPANLRGIVKTPEGDAAIGAPVYIHAMDADLQARLGGTRTARADQEGRFRLDGLPPGRYQVVSSFQLQDPDTGVWGAGTGEVVILSGGKTADISLTLSNET